MNSIIKLSLELWPENIKLFERGSILFWQGDPVDQLYILIDGAVKISAISLEGKVYSFGISGPGSLFGAKSYLLDGKHEAIAEVLEDSKLLVIRLQEFEQALISDQSFSAAVMKELAREASKVSGQARDLSFLDVQDRLKHSLSTLAREHGIQTEAGILIDLIITQDELGTLVSANRTTIAACLKELRSQGFLWKEGRRLIIIPPEHMVILDALTQAVVDGDDLNAEKRANEALIHGIDPIKILEALATGMKQVDREYSKGEMDLPDVVLAASAMKQALPIIEENIELEQIHENVVGTVIIGTVFGDVHEIGKTIVAMLLRARNFKVIDLGVNVSPHLFIEAIRENKPDILALSALTTASSHQIPPIVEQLIEEGLRAQVKLMVGGGAISETYAKGIKADGYHVTAQGAVETAWQLCTWDENLNK